MGEGRGAVCSQGWGTCLGICPTSLGDEGLVKPDETLCSKPAVQGSPASAQTVFKDALIVMTPIKLLPPTEHYFEYFPYINVFNPPTKTMG